MSSEIRETLDKHSIDLFNSLGGFATLDITPLDATGGNILPPSASDELIEETAGVFDHLLFDSGSGDDGFVLVNE